MSPTPSSSAAAAAALAALLSGCSFDLSLPSGDVARVTGITPRSAFAGQVLAVSGSGFESDPESNVVVFARATARAFALVNGTLLVRVPVDAETGTVGVTTRYGTSAAFDGFTYLGAGQLARGEVVSEIRLVHAARRMFAIDGRVFLDSTLASGVLSLDDPSFFAPGGGRQVPTTGGGAVYTMDVFGDSAVSTNKWLRRVVAATGETTQRLLDQDRFDNVGYVQRAAGDRLVGLGPDPSDPGHLAAFALDPLTLADLGPPTALPVYLSSAPQDAGQGVLALFALPASGQAPVLALLDTSGASPVYRPVASGAHVLDRDTLALGVGTGPRGPGFDASLHRLAAVGLSNGSVAIADLDAPTPAFVGPEIDTHSPSAIEALLFTGGGLLVATKPGDGVVLGIDLATRTVAWAVAAQQPTRMALAGGLVHVAQRTDDALLVIDPLAGRLVGAVRARVEPGTFDGWGGISFQAGASDPYLAQYLADAPYIVIGHPRALLRYSLGIVQPIVAGLPFEPSLTGVSSYGTIWAAGASALAPPDLSSPDVYPMAATPRRFAFEPGWIVVGHDAGVSLVRGDDTLGGQIWAGATLDAPVFRDVGFLPQGAAWAAVEIPDPGSGGVRRWALLGYTVQALQAGDGTLRGIWITGADGTGQFGAAAVFEDGLWLFGVTSAGASYAGLVDPAWNATGAAGIDRLVSYAPIVSNAVVSPNRRTFVHWERNFRGGSDLYVRSADPETTFAALAFVHLPGQVSGMTFDDRGERLFVLTGEPDSLVVLE
jgi:hypothetical protein